MLAIKKIINTGGNKGVGPVPLFMTSTYGRKVNEQQGSAHAAICAERRIACHEGGICDPYKK